MNSKTKNIILITGFLFVLWFAYQFAFTKTIAVKKEYRQLQTQKELFTNIPKQLALLNEKNEYYQKQLKKYQLSETSLQNSLLKNINAWGEEYKYKVTDFKQPHVFKASNLTKNTYRLTLEGDYIPLLKALYQLEQKSKFGEVLHVNFIKKKNYRLNKYYLQAEIMIQNFN